MSNTQAFRLVPVQSASHGGRSGWVTVFVGSALAGGLTYYLTRPTVDIAAEALFWYSTGLTVPGQKSRAIAHLKALEAKTSGTEKTTIQGYVKNLGG